MLTEAARTSARRTGSWVGGGGAGGGGVGEGEGELPMTVAVSP